MWGVKKAQDGVHYERFGSKRFKKKVNRLKMLN